MLSLYRTNLEVRLRTIDDSSLQSDSQKKIYSTVSEMLKMPAKASMAARNLEWDEIYKAESLIALLYSGAQLREEISARLQELAIESLTDADPLRRDYEVLLKPAAEAPNSVPDDAMLRVFLLRVMEAIHWSAKKKYLARPIRIEATNRILKGLLVSFALLVAPYIFLIFDFKSVPDAPGTPPAISSPASDSQTGPRPAEITRAGPAATGETAGKPSAAVSKVWSLFALWTAVTAGLLGAFFSRLISMQRQWAHMTLDEVFLHREWPYTLLRAGVGVCGALIMYFFLRSGIAAGALFPEFDQVKIEFVNVPGGSAVPMTFVMPSKSLALLTFWCFLAGFSESLVPSILSTTERQLTDAATPAQASRK